MTELSSWRYIEFQKTGRDYDDPHQVESYDSCHSIFRDIDCECRTILDSLDLAGNAILIELVTDTGTFALHASHRFARVYAVEVSHSKLDFASRKAAKVGAANITFCHAGFLTYEHQDENADAIVSSLAFHHLPDFWKEMALARMNGMLKKGGRLFISDVVFEQTGAAGNISRWIDHFDSNFGEQMAESIADHIREEYSTFDWIMQGLLERAGFRILSSQMDEVVMARYLCAKEIGIAG